MPSSPPPQAPPRTPPKTPTWDELLAEAEAAFRNGDLSRAAASATLMLRDDAEDGRALLILGATALAQRSHIEALAFTDRAIARWRRDGEAVPAALWHNRGIALGGLGRIDDAVTSLAAAVEDAPNHRQYRTSLAMLLHAAGRQDEATAVALAAAGAPENIVGAAVAYERGDLKATRLIIDATRVGFAAGAREQLADRQWHELDTYRVYLDALVTYRRAHPEPPTRSRETLYLVGDSHVLSPARFPLRFGGRSMVAIPRLVFGVKAWHLAQAQAGRPNLYAAALARALHALPEGAVAALSVGEIDCRADEGFLPALRRDGALDPARMREVIRETVAQALAFAGEQAREAGLDLHVVNVPAPRHEFPGRGDEDARAVVDIVRGYNEALAESAERLGMRVIDVHGESAGADGFAVRGRHLDSVHLMPDIFAKATARRAGA